jgi:hypothetical protein
MWSVAGNAPHLALKAYHCLRMTRCEQESGFEEATEYAPYHLGRQEVAAADGLEGWTPWTGAAWNTTQVFVSVLILNPGQREH